MDKIPGIKSGSGRFGASKYTIGYIRVSFYSWVFSGISGYEGYVRVFTGITGTYGYLRVYRISSLFLVGVSKLLKFDGYSGDLEGIHANI